ncbi:MAG TPA: hypothetical protein DCQ99_03515 [Nitrospinae bacterium]|nr:hypothetical protein [Nitrospinota bacterium]HBA27325.1 hypothetical protein [Nitrospinota bacterium]
MDLIPFPNIKVKLAELYSSASAIGKISNMQLPVKTAYYITMTLRKIQPHLKDLEDMRIKLIDKYGKDREGGGREVPPENMKSFMDSFNEVLNEEVTLNIQRIHINSLGDIMLSPQDLMPTEWLIIEDNEKDEKKT